MEKLNIDLANMPRALLTERERDVIAGRADVTDQYRYQTISRIRKRFERLHGDIEAMEAHGELANEFREVVCGDSGEEQ